MPVYQDKRGRWNIGFMQGGRRVHRVCPEGTTRAQAVEWETRLRQEVFRIDKLGELPDYTLGEAVMRYLDEYTGKDKSRVEGKVRAFADLIQGHRLLDVAKVADRVRQSNEGSPATRNRRLAILRRTANLAYRKWGWLREPLGEKIQLLPENNHREVYLSKEQIQALAEAQENERVKAAIYIAAYTGLRSGEILSLDQKDIKDGVIHVKTSKSGKPRMVPVVPFVRPYLRVLPISLHPSTLSHAVSGSMPGVRFHDLRHSCASLLLAAGVDLYTISKILGHSSIQVTQRYAHLQLEQMKKAMRKIGGPARN